MTRARVVVAGLGDTGLLTAIHLAPHVDVVAIGVQPSHVSGQELGLRITRPHYWARDYWIGYDRYRRLRSVRVVQAELTGCDLRARHVTVRRPDGTTRRETYDVLVISTGVRNGFWRQPQLRSEAEVAADLHGAHCRVASADSVIVIGGGAAAVSSAANIALTWPNKRVDLYYPGERPLPRHHPRVWRAVRKRLERRGVGLHAGHRAIVPDGFECDRITSDPVAWQTGQAPATADAVLWAVGRVRPNSGWLPREVLDDHGFVRADADLTVPGHDGVFAIGDVAATDPLRSSARNRADRLLARNVRAWLGGRPLRRFRPPRRRWGSVMGAQPDGLTVFGPTGHAFRFPAWSVDTILQPWIVRWGIYRGVRRS